MNPTLLLSLLWLAGALSMIFCMVNAGHARDPRFLIPRSRKVLWIMGSILCANTAAYAACSMAARTPPPRTVAYLILGAQILVLIVVAARALFVAMRGRCAMSRDVYRPRRSAISRLFMLLAVACVLTLAGCNQAGEVGLHLDAAVAQADAANCNAFRPLVDRSVKEHPEDAETWKRKWDAWKIRVDAQLKNAGIAPATTAPVQP